MRMVKVMGHGRVWRNNIKLRETDDIGVGFFFSSRRRHTRCSRDWSSDVCSSDLWAHGYAYESRPYNALFDPQWKEGEQPWVLGRKRFGKIAIANSDAGASAETDAAIDQAWRAVGEVLHG